MPREEFSNNAVTQLAGAIDDSQDNFDVVDGSVLPVLAAGQQFRLRVEGEEMIVGARTGNHLSSVTRHAEGTTPLPHADGTTVVHNLTAGSLASFRQTDDPIVLATTDLTDVSATPASDGQVPAWDSGSSKYVPTNPGGVGGGGGTLTRYDTVSDTTPSHNPTPTSPTAVDDLSIAIGPYAADVPVTFAILVEFTKNAGDHFSLAYDGTLVWPFRAGDSAVLTSRAQLNPTGDDWVFTAGGTLVVPGDGVSHTLAVYYDASSNTNATTFGHRRLTLLAVEP